MDPESYSAYKYYVLGVPTSLGDTQKFLRAKRATFTKKKNVFCSKKLLFQPFFLNCKIENGLLMQFFSIILCSNLFSKLFEIGEKLLKNPFTFLAVFGKG